MKRSPQLSSLCRLALSTTALATITTVSVTSALALTDAGQKIQNQATATYKDALGNDYTAQSNLASVEVKQVYFATLESDGAKEVASNQTAYFQHILTNTGNGQDTYTVSVAQDDSSGSDSGDFSTLKVYVDANDNGVVDAGENEVTSVDLEAGEQVSLVVAGLVPTATDGQTFDATLTVSSANGTVTDLTASKGLDTLDGTNEDTATVSGDAILNVFKSSTHDITNSQITYNVTVTNTGNSTAKDVILFDGLPAGTTLVSVSGSGFGTGIDASDVDAVSGSLSEVALGLDLNGDGDLTDVSETDLNLDLNTDGTMGAASIAGVYGFDDELDPGTSIELTFTVSYDAAVLGAGEKIENIAHVTGDTDDNPATNDGVAPSTKTTDTVPQSYAVTVTDTGANAGPGVNDGGDDDTANDSQLVDTAQAGELVLFTHIVTNTGNGTDTFELTVDNITNFPLGTSFTIWNETGTVQLLNTNGEGGVDTGPMDAGDVMRFRVQAQLPPNGGGAANASYDITATSSADISSSPANDDAKGRLTAIVAPTVDLANDSADDNPLANKHAYNNDGTPITTKTANPGDTVTFSLFIENDSQVADSFQLASGGFWNGTTLGALPAGWSVAFQDTGGTVITTTPSIAPGEQLEVTAYVTLPASESQALADRTFVVDGAGSNRVDGNGDSDGDYGVFFRVQSVNSGASDVKLDAVDVLPNEEITLLQNNSGQIQPGGSIDYPHTLTNDGNTSESLSLSAVNSAANWSNNLLVDTDGDGTAETPFSSLAVGATVYYFNTAGVLTAGTLDANLRLELDPGESLSFVVRVFAPTSAPNGQLDTVTVTASFNNGGDEVINIDRSEVVESQLRLNKTASVDASCAGAALATLGPDVGFTPTAGVAAPADCVVWQVVATNTGVDKITDVDITDSIPAFSAYKSGTLRICDGDAGQAQTALCTFEILSDNTGDDEGHFSGGDISYKLGGGTTPKLAVSEIISGGSVTVRFSSEVE